MVDAHDHYRIAVVPRASRDLDLLPAKIASACVEFIFTALPENPYRVSKPLVRELAGQRSARRGAYRVIFRVTDEDRLVEVLHVSHRAHAYRT